MVALAVCANTFSIALANQESTNYFETTVIEESIRSSTRAQAEANFFEQVTKRNGTYVKGRGVALTSDRHVDLDTRIHYQKINGKIRFTMATNGNNWITHRSHILFPAYGDVVFEVKNQKSELIQFNFMNEPMFLEATSNTLYVVENNADYIRRMKAIEEYNAGQPANSANILPKTGKLIAKVTYDLYDHQIDLFEVCPGNELKQTGSFKGLFHRAH